MTCSFAGCDKLRIARGLCSGHYGQRRRGIVLAPLGRVPSMSPTPRQVEVLRLVATGATIREVGIAIGVASTNGVTDHILALTRKGLVGESKSAGKHRRLRITPAGLAAIGLRCCDVCNGAGTVRA